MQNSTQLQSFPRNLIRAFVFTALPLVLLNCGNQDAAHRGPEQGNVDKVSAGLGPIGSPCEFTADCADDPAPPTCGATGTGVCKLIDRTFSEREYECVYAVSADENCVCVEGDVRTCALTSTTTGIKRCLEIDTGATSWGGCGSL